MINVIYNRGVYLSIFIIYLLFFNNSFMNAQQVLRQQSEHYKVASVIDLTGSVSPDGRYYAFTDWRTGNLAVKDLKTGEERHLTDKESWLESNDYARSPRISPDGSLEVPLLKGSAYEHVLDWTPDGRGLLFASDRDLPIGVGRRAWLLEIVEGRPQADPELVKPEIGVVRGLGFGPDDSYYYCCGDLDVEGWRSVNDIYMATLDPGTGKLDPATKLVTRIGFRSSIEWSPDGRYLAYSWWAWPQPSVLGIRSLETGEERRLQLTIRLSGTVLRPQWSRDGHTLLVVARNVGNHGDTYRIDAGSGEVTLVIQDCCEWGVWSNDKTVIFVKYTSDKVGELRSIVVKELDTGLEKELYQAASPVNLTHLALSPDGRLLAFVESNTEEAKTTIMVLPMAGGETRTLVDLPPPMNDSFSRPILALVWTPRLTPSHLRTYDR